MSITDDLETLLKQQQETQEQNQKINRQISEQFSTIKKRIQEGESTGDTIRDYCIVVFGIGTNWDNIIQDIAERTKENLGKPILVINQKKTPLMHNYRTGLSFENGTSLIPDRNEIHTIDAYLRIGIITTQLNLNINDGTITFPMEYHAAKRNREEWTLVQKPISISTFEFMDYERTNETNNHTPYENFTTDCNLHIFIGEEVTQYFRTPRGTHTTDITEFATAKEGTWIDSTYTEALHLLDKK